MNAYATVFRMLKEEIFWPVPIGFGGIIGFGVASMTPPIDTWPWSTLLKAIALWTGVIVLLVLAIAFVVGAITTIVVVVTSIARIVRWSIEGRRQLAAAEAASRALRVALEAKEAEAKVLLEKVARIEDVNYRDDPAESVEHRRSGTGG